MAIVTSTGIEGTKLSEYKSDLEEIFRAAFGEDLVVDADTPQGTAIGLLALRLTEFDEKVVGQSNSLAILDASGQQIDGLAAILAIARNGDEPSLVSVILTGVPGTVVPAGSLARSTAGDLFVLRADVVINADGSADGMMESVEGGPVACAAGTITGIVSGLTGWETLDNPEAGQLGQLKESDYTFRKGYFRKLFKNATSPREAVLAEVLNQQNVLEAVCEENDTDTAKIVKGVELPPHSIVAVVLGGADTDIAQAIQRKKTGGASTAGDTAVTVPTTRSGGRKGPDIVIRFYRAAQVGMEIDLDIDPGASFPTNGVSLLKERIMAYFAGTLDLQTTQDKFEMDGLLIGDAVAKSRLYTPINSVPGHVVNSISLRRKGGENVEVAAMSLLEKAVILSSDDITITKNGAA
jgi:uncharacterized phage protein gp47/JayE